MVDVNTTVFNKQLEELESLADSTGLYDDQQDDDEEEVQAEPSMEWRRATLEESYSRVKRAKARPVDPHRTYEIGTLLFEPAEGKFGRVKRSVPGYLSIQFLRGGEREYGRRPDVETFLRDHHRGKTAAELAMQLGLTETEVQGHLNRLGLVRVDIIPGAEGAVAEEDKKEKVAAPRPKGKAAARDLIPGAEEDDRRARHDDELPPLPPAGKSGLPHKADGKTGLPQKGKTSVPVVKGKTALPAGKAGKTLAPGGGGSRTPMTAEAANAFIQKNYKSMSNKDMAEKTGLSEHTIRRKLGEWGLKR